MRVAGVENGLVEAGGGLVEKAGGVVEGIGEALLLDPLAFEPGLPAGLVFAPPDLEPPKPEMPEALAPNAEVLKAEVPEALAPTAEVPDALAPKAGVPNAEVPDALAPKAGVPNAEVPDALAQKAGVPNAEVSEVAGASELEAAKPLLPNTELPNTELPKVEKPEPEALLKGEAAGVPAGNGALASALQVDEEAASFAKRPAIRQTVPLRRHGFADAAAAVCNNSFGDGKCHCSSSKLAAGHKDTIELHSVSTTR